MTYHELKKSVESKLDRISDEKTGEAMLILEYASHFSYTEIISKYHDECPEETIKTAEEITEKRLERIPLQYLIGKVEFFGVEFETNENVLIPRPDTEIICEKALEILKENDHIADICCGTGCIGLSLMKHVNVYADFYDISPDCIKTTLKNATNLGLMERINIYKRDVFDDSFFFGCEKYDLIISNPPYIERNVIETLSEEVKHEPVLALDGGEDGLDFYRRFLDILPGMLNENGKILFEIGYNQGKSINEICNEHGYKCSVFKDYSGNDRCALIEI